jgi:hypothetical protein
MASKEQYLETKRKAAYAVKSLYCHAIHEMCLSYYYMRSNLDSAFLPFPIFTTASLLHKKAEPGEMLSSIARTYAKSQFSFNNGD